MATKNPKLQAVRKPTEQEIALFEILLDSLYGDTETDDEYRARWNRECADFEAKQQANAAQVA